MLGIMLPSERIDTPIDTTDASVRHMPEVLEPGPANSFLHENEDEAPSSGDQSSQYKDGTALDSHTLHHYVG